MKNKIVMALAVLVVLGGLFYIFIHFGSSPQKLSGVQDNTIRIVAAEDFYGNIAQQLGGLHVSVTSILSDPNVDPHEYESSVQDGVAITNANIVIENGLEYDTWIDKLLSASPNPSRILITAGDVASNPLPENPHVWYGIDNISSIARAITNSLEKIDPANTADYENNIMAFNNSLIPINHEIAEIKADYAGTPVGLTETIYLYQTQPMGLSVLTPFNFEKAVAEGNDPSAQSVNITNAQVANKQIKVLIYNSQTVTPITSNLQTAAAQNNIPIVAVSETMPPSDTYQSWMTAELDSLQQALAQATGH
jgi:zinc/manganese transport system substrate-binding protein